MVIPGSGLRAAGCRKPRQVRKEATVVVLPVCRGSPGAWFIRPMYQVIARKYRPQSFSELIGQEHVRTTLENAINQNRIAHGYIFSGQRGTGKTTVARILARCLNCIDGPTTQPCGVCASCLEIARGNAVDVIEIDAASNRGINEMRELRDNVRYRPARDRYKVFIVDEAHQITNEAFNALLKTLEEPPEWVVFVLCTTEVHKIPATIGSRCQMFSFRSVDFDELIGRMRWICEQEGIQADQEALAVLANAGEGSVRDSLSALDQAIACCGAVLSADQTRQLLGMFSLESLNRVAEALRQSDSSGMLDVVQELERNGHNLQHFVRELARYFRNLLVAKITGANTRLIAASPREQEQLAEVAAHFTEEDLTRYLQLTLDLFKDLQFALQPRLHLEIGLLRLVHAGRILPIEEALAQAGSAPPKTPLPSRNREGAAPRTAGPSPFERDSVRKTPSPAPARPEPKNSVAVLEDPASTDWRARLYEVLCLEKLQHTADAVEHSNIQFTGTELIFTTSRVYGMAIKTDPELPGLVQQLAGRPVKITVKQGEANRAGVLPPSAPAGEGDSSLRERALDHPEVKRFQELFPDAQVRAVRDLKS
jgi:DNA polymerase III subunit gamma/tau